MSRRAWVLYPVFIAPYPAIASYARNALETPLSELAWPVVLMTAGAALIWGLLWLALREPARAGLLTVVALAVFHTIVPAPQWVDSWLRYLSGFWVSRDVHVWPPLVFGGEMAIAGAAVYLVNRLKCAAACTAVLNLFAILLLALPLGDIVRIRSLEPPQVSAPEEVACPEQAPAAPRPGALPIPRPPGRLPDIYYVVLDGYARSDVMRDHFGFDNAPFLEWLEEKGFSIARQSTANYCQTPLSLSSALNIGYLNGLIPAESHNKAQLNRWIGDGVVVRTLRSLGYQFVSFATGFSETELPDADRYLAASAFLSPFHEMLINRTPLGLFLSDPGVIDAYSRSRDRTLFLLRTVPEVARWRQPTFTFAHIVAPHPPFVFGESGEDVSQHERQYCLSDGDVYNTYYGDSETYAEGYRKQASFITKQVQRMLEALLANSPEPPVILLQSDHGPGRKLSTKSAANTDLHERMSILNAYYLPGAKDAPIYPGISPVNSFRILLHEYFQAELDLLPDRSYYSTWDDPFEFIDVTDKVQPPTEPGPNAGRPTSSAARRGETREPGEG